MGARRWLAGDWGDADRRARSRKQGDLDSNQDKQNQNLSCYRYTIALSPPKELPRKAVSGPMSMRISRLGRAAKGPAKRIHEPHHSRIPEKRWTVVQSPSGCRGNVPSLQLGQSWTSRSRGRVLHAEWESP